MGNNPGLTTTRSHDTPGRRGKRGTRIQQGLLGQREGDTMGHSHPQTVVQQGRSEENKHCGLSVLPEPPRPPPNQGTAGRTASRPGGTEGQRPAWALGVPAPKDLTVLLLPGGGRPPPDSHCNASPGPQPAVHPADGNRSALHAGSQFLRLKLSAYTARWLCFLQGRQSLSNRRGDGRPHRDLY